MNFKFWFLLFASIFIPVSILAFLGFRSMEDFQRQSEESAWKRDIKADQGLYLSLLNGKASLLREEAERRFQKKKSRREAPFLL